MYRTLLEGVWLSGQWIIYTFHISRSHTSEQRAVHSFPLSPNCFVLGISSSFNTLVQRVATPPRQQSPILVKFADQPLAQQHIEEQGDNRAHVECLS